MTSSHLLNPGFCIPLGASHQAVSAVLKKLATLLSVPSNVFTDALGPKRPGSGSPCFPPLGPSRLLRPPLVTLLRALGAWAAPAGGWRAAAAPHRLPGAGPAHTRGPQGTGGRPPGRGGGRSPGRGGPRAQRLQPRPWPRSAAAADAEARGPPPPAALPGPLQAARRPASRWSRRLRRAPGGRTRGRGSQVPRARGSGRAPEQVRDGREGVDRQVPVLRVPAGGREGRWGPWEKGRRAPSTPAWDFPPAAFVESLGPGSFISSPSQRPMRAQEMAGAWAGPSWI